jgi:ribosome maturation factor RimP
MALELERVREIAERITSSGGLELVDVEFRGGGKSRMLRITIDKPTGVSHEDCANVSREVGTILDIEDAVRGPYLLEVTSPGLGRELSRPVEFQRFVGSLIRLTTREPINGNRHLEGRLESAREGRITLSLEYRQPKGKGKRKQQAAAEARRVEVELANVEKANLVPEI